MNNLKIEYNPCLELSALIGLLGSMDKYEAMLKELNYNLCEKDMDIINRANSLLSTYIKNEIKYFYNISLDIHIIIYAFVEDYNISNVENLFETLEKSSDVELLNYLGGIFAGSESKKETSDWTYVKDDVTSMKNYISNNIEDAVKRNSFLECAENLEETKQRIILIFKQVYKNIFKVLELEILVEIKKYGKNYEAFLTINPVEFVKKYLLNTFDPINNEWPYRLNLHFSFFLFMGYQVISLHDCISKEGRCLLGIHTNDMFKSKNMKDKLDKFSRALSDDRRINIIKLLSEKPYYGYEIAGELNLTPATINYHMNFLLLADLLIFEKVDNKVYYTLNKENLKELFGEFQKYLLNE